MTKETRITFDLGDLTAVRADCESCGGEVISNNLFTIFLG